MINYLSFHQARLAVCAGLVLSMTLGIISPAQSETFPHFKAGAWETTTKIDPEGLGTSPAAGALGSELGKARTTRVCIKGDEEDMLSQIMGALQSRTNMTCTHHSEQKSSFEWLISADCEMKGGMAMKIHSTSNLIFASEESYRMDSVSSTNIQLGGRSISQSMKISGSSVYLGSDCSSYGAKTLEERLPKQLRGPAPGRIS